MLNSPWATRRGSGNDLRRDGRVVKAPACKAGFVGSIPTRAFCIRSPFPKRRRFVSDQRPKCIGFGVREGSCQRPIDAEARALNPSEFWCVECEIARRAALKEQFAVISKSFGAGKDDA